MLPPNKGLIYRYRALSLTVQQSHAIITGCYGKLLCQPPRSGWGSPNLNETDLEIDSAICSMMEALSPVDVNVCYSEAFQQPSSPNKKAEKFNIHLSMVLLLKVLSKCNTCCQSWIDPWIVRNNREMAFRSIIKLCYKCHQSSGMEFMHTYYYPGNSKGSADPLSWKQYNLPFSFPPPTYSEPSNSRTRMFTLIYDAPSLPVFWDVDVLFLWHCFSFGALCDTFYCRTGPGMVQYCTCICQALHVQYLSFWDPGAISDSLVRRPPARYAALQNQMIFCKHTPSLTISTTKVKCVCSLKDRVAVKWHTALKLFTRTNKDLCSLYPEGRSSEVKRVRECCDRIKGFFDLSVSLCTSRKLKGHLTVRKTHGL